MFDKSKEEYSRFKDSPFRSFQKEAIEFAYGSKKKVTVIIAPTGSGKSLIGMTLGNLYDNFLYLVSSKHLQDQLRNDFPEAEMMMGRDNYPCILTGNTTANDCLHSQRTPCRYKRNGCPYEDQKKKTLEADKRILNYSYFLTESNYIGRFSGFPVVIADEADSLEDMLSDIISLDFSSFILKRWGLPYPKYRSLSEGNPLKHWREWAKECIGIMNDNINEIDDDIDSPSVTPVDALKLTRERQKMVNMNGRLNSILVYMDETWIVNIQKTNMSTLWSLRPTWLNPEMTNKYFFRHGDKFVMMSATFPYKDVFAEMLGLSTSDMDIIEVPSTFPLENRMVNLMFSADMKNQKGGNGIDPIEIEKTQKAIVGIIDKHKGEKGIIHTVNWKLNQAIMDIGDPRLITHTPTNKGETVDEFLKSKDRIFVSPSSTRGIDLFDDRSRFNIIAKCPYKNLGDKLVSARVFGRGIGEYWYKSVCAQEIVQACGRSVRHREDWCNTYILDKQACKLIIDNQKLFPRYFIEAVDVC